jgi:hypothetical protein
LGLWTEGDAATAFDDLVIQRLPEVASARLRPSQKQGLTQ